MQYQLDQSSKVEQTNQPTVVAISNGQIVKDEDVKSVDIDVEYSGHENTIKNIVIQLLRKYKKPIPAISFALVGKKSNAHKTAIAVLRGREKPTRIVKAKEVLLLFYK